MSSYGIKFYIQDKNANYVDFTDILEKRGKNKLVSLGAVVHKTENVAVGSAFISSIGEISMDNTDGFWDDPTKWVGTMTTTLGGTAVWNYSTNGGEVALQKAKCKIVVETLQKDGTVKEDTVGVFKVLEFNTDTISGTANLKLVSLSYWLRKLDASEKRNGRGWYENRNIVFLMKELLKMEFADSSQDLPTSFSFPNTVIITTFDGDRVLSSYGTPPDRVI